MDFGALVRSVVIGPSPSAPGDRLPSAGAEQQYYCDWPVQDQLDRFPRAQQHDEVEPPRVAVLVKVASHQAFSVGLTGFEPATP